MTATWITPPQSTLGSRSAPVRFRASGHVPAISVGVSGRVEERAYRAGAFLYPYLDSVRVIDQFLLLRTGGWLGDFVVYVDECSAGTETPSVTWVTPPSSTLASPSAPVIFRIGQVEVPAISVSVAGKPEERVYRDGAFVWPYLDSVKKSTQFTLHRTGGWRDDFQVHVDECDAGAPSGQYVIDGSGRFVVDGLGHRVVP